ncbi:MAG TPA: hypothetical protein VHH88_01375 [Verrucomicrobiae bacterium]|nr:hypothetical protein [Verrucomicrobiae bacterium]
MNSHKRLLSLLSLLLLFFLGPRFIGVATAATIWDGPLVTFSEPETDPTLEADQDRITPAVWITRAGTMGLFNAVTESAFSHFSSPADTEWANGELANYASLSFTDWNTWAHGINASPFDTVGVDAVLHLITEDIYIGIKFTFWGGAEGGFAYERTTAPQIQTVTPIPLLVSQSGTNLVLTWSDARFSLQTATDIHGPYTTIASAASPYSTNISGPQAYFRLVH